MRVKIVDITAQNFQSIPRPANNRFNCRECFYWMAKKDGRTNLVRQKKNWFVKKGRKYGGSLGKLLLWGKRETPVGFAQFGPIAEFGTAQLFYKSLDFKDNGPVENQRELPLPKGGWCVSCVAIQPNYRGQGLATRIVRNILRDLKRRGVKTVDVYPIKKVGSWNQISNGPNGLWKKCGFQEVVKVKYEKGKPIPSEKEKEIIIMRRKW